MSEVDPGDRPAYTILPPQEEVASLVAQLVESACNAGDPGLISGLGRSPGEGNGSPLLYSCLENSMDEPGGLQSMGSQKSRTRLSDFHSSRRDVELLLYVIMDIMTSLPSLGVMFLMLILYNNYEKEFQLSSFYRQGNRFSKLTLQTLMPGIGFCVHLTSDFVLCLVAKSCPTLCDPTDCTLPGSSVPEPGHGLSCLILQSRILE